MKVRQGGSWVDVNTYIRQNNQWVFVGNFSDANEFLLVISQTTTDLNLQAAFVRRFGTTAWVSTKRKRVVINSGVIVGSLNPANYALTIPPGLGGSLTIDNYGSIQGAGGLPNGGTGGNAIIASSPVTFNNQGTIYAGGGAGGAGGTGGQGVYGYDCSYLSCNDSGFPVVWLSSQSCNFTTPSAVCQELFGGDYFCIDDGYVYCGGLCADSYSPICCTTCCTTVPQTCYAYTNGGAGGAGGRGQGYDGNLTGGSPGGAGGINAGVGGYGGTGGNWGQSGNSGFSGSNGNYTVGTGGGPGGLAGFYIVNNGNVTWTNLGTVAGRVI